MINPPGAILFVWSCCYACSDKTTNGSVHSYAIKGILEKE